MAKRSDLCTSSMMHIIKWPTVQGRPRIKDCRLVRGGETLVEGLGGSNMSGERGINKQSHFRTRMKASVADNKAGMRGRVQMCLMY